MDFIYSLLPPKWSFKINFKACIHLFSNTTLSNISNIKLLFSHEYHLSIFIVRYDRRTNQFFNGFFEGEKGSLMFEMLLRVVLEKR